MLIKEKRGTENLVTNLLQDCFKEESGRVSKKMINHARSWLYLLHVIGYCSKSINCDRCRIVDELPILYGFRSCRLFPEKDRRTRYNGKGDPVRKLCIFGTFESSGNAGRALPGTVPWFAVYQQMGGELDFYVRSLLDYKNYGLEVKAGKSTGNTAAALLDAGLLDFLYYLKGNTYGGTTEEGKIQNLYQSTWLEE